MMSGEAGGWSFILAYNGHILKKWGRVRKQNATGNQMEMQAAIEALQAIRPDSLVTIYSDSQYLVFGMQDASRKRNANRDYWKRLDEAVSMHKEVKWNWIPREMNADADVLSKRALRSGQGQERIGGKRKKSGKFQQVQGQTT